MTADQTVLHAMRVMRERAARLCARVAAGSDGQVRDTAGHLASRIERLSLEAPNSWEDGGPNPFGDAPGLSSRSTDPVAELLGAMVGLLSVLAAADAAKARLPGNCHSIERALLAIHRFEGGFMPPSLQDMAARVRHPIAPAPDTPPAR